MKVGNSNWTLRLVDDGFVKICGMVNDLSLKVRSEALSLMVCILCDIFLVFLLDISLKLNSTVANTLCNRVTGPVVLNGNV